MIVPTVDPKRFESFTDGDVISPLYRRLQEELHARPKGYGGKGDKWAAGVRDLMVRFEATSLLDYGCGEGALVKALSVNKPDAWRLSEYDPAVPGKHLLPSFADLVVSTDVLEHVEPDKLPRVLAHLQMLARKAVFLVVATRPSNKTMADGRNAHLIVRPAEWWEQQVKDAGFVIAPDPPASPLIKPSREWAAVLV